MVLRRVATTGHQTIYCSGQYFGEDIILGSPRNYTVHCLSYVDSVTFSKDSLSQILSSNNFKVHLHEFRFPRVTRPCAHAGLPPKLRVASVSAARRTRAGFHVSMRVGRPRTHGCDARLSSWSSGGSSSQ